METEGSKSVLTSVDLQVSDPALSASSLPVSCSEISRSHEARTAFPELGLGPHCQQG